ncbi:MAG: aminotransferase, partial [Alphaproteobacteria bacterium]|nr:aminotransferase [Alphaproteobacteria bacterium]
MNIALNSPSARDIAHHIHPQTDLVRLKDEGPLLMERGEGIRVIDEDGKAYIDTVAGLWCASLGFSSERLARVAYEQMRRLGYYHTFRQRGNLTSVDLAEKLLGIAPVPMSKVLFQCSGSEANDTAIKLVWYYHNAIGKPEKCKIVGRQKGYHGSTIAAVSLSGKPDMHQDFNLPLPGFLHTDCPHYYRFAEDGESEEDFATRMADSLERLILAEGPETVAAFFAEPVMGGGGALIPPRTYFEKVQAVLAKYEVLFVADEVICGFGRTGNMWGSQTFDLKPDMITCAKALSAAFQPISAVMISEPIYQAMLTESAKVGSFAHGYTHAGHPVATAVALEALKIYEEEDIVAQVRATAPRFQDGLARLGAHPLIGDVKGVGLVCGLEMVADKATKESFPAETKLAGRLEAAGKQNGIILRTVGDRIAFSPPLIISE